MAVLLTTTDRDKLCQKNSTPEPRMTPRTGADDQLIVARQNPEYYALDPHLAFRARML